MSANIESITTSYTSITCFDGYAGNFKKSSDGKTIYCYGSGPDRTFRNGEISYLR